MASETLFLQPVFPNNDPPNFAEATGSAQFFNFSQNASGSLTSAEFDILVKGGVASAIANANATFVNDPTFTDLFTENSAVGEDGAFNVKSKSETKVVANFEVSAGQTLSFDFTSDLDLEAKEIENPDAEYSKAKSKTTFVVLDISNDVANPTLLDFFGLNGNLISSEEKGNLKSGSSGNISFTSFGDTDVDGDNGIDSVTGFATGSYQRTFSSDTQLAIVELNTSLVRLRGDTLINTLSDDVIDGTIWEDTLEGSNDADSIYGSLGADVIHGKRGDDILEGGHGKDTLNGNGGDDQIHGGQGRDRLTGGRGDDTLVGGDGKDTIVGGLGSDVMTGGNNKDHFVFKKEKSLLPGEYNVITDFQIGFDRIKFQDWGQIDSEVWFNEAVSQGRIIDAQEGVLLSFNRGGKIFFEAISVSELSASDFVFS